jgi:hypothetical protein
MEKIPFRCGVAAMLITGNFNFMMRAALASDGAFTIAFGVAGACGVLVVAGFILLRGVE